MTGDRPFIHYRIAQLEAVLARAHGDPATLRALAHELSLRKTDRAARLRVEIAKAQKAFPPLATPPAKTTPVAQGDTVRQPVSAPVPRYSPVPAQKAQPSADRLSDTSNGNVAASAPVAILSAWTALEALSPQTYRTPEDLAGGDRRAVVNLSREALPWEAGERSRKNYQLHYQVVLGAIRMDRATERLAAAFGADEERSPRQRDKAALAVVILDRAGVPLETGAIAISSFAWGLPMALRQEFTPLGSWPRVEPDLIEELDALLRRRDRDGNTKPLDRATIDRAHRGLVQRFGLPVDLVEPPSFAMRVYHYYRAKSPPEPALLNSFFLNDLVQATTQAEKGQLPSGLRRFLGADTVANPVDLLADRTALERAVAPSLMPAARWPSPGGHPLVLLQQAAVNLTRSQLAGQEGLIAVNGPPGTGKTTLLRDLVAACVLDRAVAMAAFDDRASAFTRSGERIAAGEKASYQLYTLHPSLKGHEVLVASSNNKAVENISRELPSIAAVGRPAEEIGYFRTVSDVVHGPRADTEDDEPAAGVTPEAGGSWGLIAAVLGNRNNLAAFQQAFWWDEERGFRLYLKAAKGDVVERDVIDPATGQSIGRRPPAIVTEEQPPSPEAAKAAWQAARDRFLTLKREIDAELSALEIIRDLCVDLATTRQAVGVHETRMVELASRRPPIEADRRSCESALRQAHDGHAECLAAVERSRRARPGLFARLIRSSNWTAWTTAHKPLADAVAAALDRVLAGERDLAAATAARVRWTADIDAVEVPLSAARQKAESLTRQINVHRPSLGDRLIDDHLFARGHAVAHLASPWLPDALQRKREDLFIAALGVHRAFIDAAAQKVHHNLGALMEVFSAGAPKEDGKRKLLPDLWSTLFLTVPVVSTTFASTGRMLGALPSGSIGWLLIDEAGQAVPQAAVGAIQRARRTVVVGDPLQIPPIVTLPKRLGDEVCRFFKVDLAIWAAPDASAQTVADRASRFQTVFRGPNEHRRVGVPLLVHRRCQEPMFGLFNAMAYSGRMVQASPPAVTTGLGQALGPSRWLDIDGPADSKWCPAEGEAVVAMLRAAAAAGETRPDLFIISPYRVVVYELRRRLEQESALLATLGLDARRWVRDRVGTIHTVQGREADTVIMVMGAPKASQVAARRWAADTPNILSVAISRAKRNLYVIGSHAAWSPIGHAQALTALPVERIIPAEAEVMPPATDCVSEVGPSINVSGGQRQRRGPSPS